MEEARMKGGNALLQRQLSLYLGIPVSLFGLLGSGLSIFIWSRVCKKRSEAQKSPGVYLITLAIIHTGLLLCFLTFEALPELFKNLKHQIRFITYSCYFGYPMYQFFLAGSVWLFIGVSANRFIAVILPEKIESLNNSRVTKFIIFSTLLFTFIFNIPHFFNKRPVKANGTSMIMNTKYGLSKGAKMYELWGSCMFIMFLPWVIVFLLNVCVIKKMLKMRIQKHKKSGQVQTEYQTTITLVVASISFLVLLLWQFVSRCFVLFHYGINDEKKEYSVSTVYASARLGMIISASMNFIIYCTSGPYFRKEIKSFLCCNERRGYTGISSTNTTKMRDSSMRDSTVQVITGYDDILVDADNHERGRNNFDEDENENGNGNHMVV